MKYVFFRIDDIYEYTPNLIALTEIFINNKIQASYQVIPDLLEEKTVAYLNQDRVIKSINDIGQHGYKHIQYSNAEFCDQRKFEQQKKDIELGRKIIEKKFPNQWSKSFTPPWNYYNNDTIDILDNLRYNFFSAYVRQDMISHGLYKILRLTKKNSILKKKISYHEKIAKGQLYEFSVSIDFNRDYKNNMLKTCNEIMKEFFKINKEAICIGFVIHPNHIREIKDMDVIKEVIMKLQMLPDVQIMSIKNIYSRLLCE